MEQCGMIRFLTLKGLKAKDIQTELEYMYEDGCLRLRQPKWRGCFLQERINLGDNRRSGRPAWLDLSNIISKRFKELSFISCKVLSQHLRISKDTCLRILHENFGPKIQDKMGPPEPDASHKAERLARPEEIVQILEKCHQNGFVILSTGDES
jgi:hypothetical protein